MGSLSIKITNMRCDAKCGYCYEAAGRDMPNKTDRPLDIPAVLKQMDYEWQKMSQLYGDNMSGEPYLHGGEALLAGHDTVEKIMKKAYELAGRTNIQTYGYLIDDKYIEIFKKYKASVGISIDGPWPLNKARPVSGMSTKEVTELVHNNILRLREEGIDVSIICVLTKANAAPDKLPKLKEWMVWLRDIGINSGRLNLAHMDLKQYGKSLELTEDEAENAWRELTRFVLLEEEGLYWQPMHDAVSSMMGLEQGTCIAGSELVFDGNGDLVPIGKWDRNTVLTYSHEHGELSVPADWKYMGRKPVVKITTDTGRTLRATPDHLISTPSGWVEAKDTKGKTVYTKPLPTEDEDYNNDIFNGFLTLEKVVDVSPDGEDDVYDIEVKHPSHRFFANGIIVHNCVFGQCEYYHAAAEPVVLSDGTTANCLKTAKTGNMYPRLEQPEYDSRGFGNVRYEVLEQIPFELSSKGGCGGCTYWRNCLGGCPAEGTDGDWRNKTRFCKAYYGLFEEAHKALKRMIPTIITTADATSAMFSPGSKGVRGMNPPAFARMMSGYTKSPSTWRGSSYVPLPMAKQQSGQLSDIEHVDGPVRHLDSDMRLEHIDSHEDHNDSGAARQQCSNTKIKARIAESDKKLEEIREKLNKKEGK